MATIAEQTEFEQKEAACNKKIASIEEAVRKRLAAFEKRSEKDYEKMIKPLIDEIQFSLRYKTMKIFYVKDLATKICNILRNQIEFLDKAVRFDSYEKDSKEVYALVLMHIENHKNHLNYNIKKVQTDMKIELYKNSFKVDFTQLKTTSLNKTKIVRKKNGQQEQHIRENGQQLEQTKNIAIE